jgi:AcrR family transcriptional regulator
MVGKAASMHGQDTKTQILAAALQRFAAQGYGGTSLNDIADDVGIRRPSLLYHFPSKEALYRSVVLGAFDSWFTLVDHADLDGQKGWPQVERVLRLAFEYFESQPAFVRLARREALDGGPLLFQEMGSELKPLFDRSVMFLEQEMDAGRLRRYDARQLVFTAYGAVLSYLSDAVFVRTLLGDDPLAPGALEARRKHVLDLLRNALTPELPPARG